MDISYASCDASYLPELWSDYLETVTETFFYGDYSKQNVGLKESILLKKILECDPYSFVAYYEMSVAMDDLSISSYAQQQNSEDAAQFEQYQTKSNEYFEKALQLSKGVSIESIEALHISDEEKGLHFYAYAQLIDDMHIKEKCMLRAYEYLKNSNFSVALLFDLLRDYFGTDHGIVVFDHSGFEKKELDYNTAEYVCEQFISITEPMLHEDIQLYLKAQLFQRIVEANAFLAYNDYFQDQIEEMKEHIEYSARFIENSRQYGNVSGREMYADHKTPLSLIYDAHLRLLYAEKRQSLTGILEAEQDYELAIIEIKSCPPIEPSIVALFEIEKDFNRICDGQ